MSKQSKPSSTAARKPAEAAADADLSSAAAAPSKKPESAPTKPKKRDSDAALPNAKHIKAGEEPSTISSRARSHAQAQQQAVNEIDEEAAPPKAAHAAGAPWRKAVRSQEAGSGRSCTSRRPAESKERKGRRGARRRQHPNAVCDLLVQAQLDDVDVDRDRDRDIEEEAPAAPPASKPSPVKKPVAPAAGGQQQRDSVEAVPNAKPGKVRRAWRLRTAHAVLVCFEPNSRISGKWHVCHEGVYLRSHRPWRHQRTRPRADRVRVAHDAALRKHCCAHSQSCFRICRIH